MNARHLVTEADTAAVVGSGDVPVLATPRLIAWLEAATVEAALRRIQEGQTSVGVSIRINHTRACAVGTEVTITAEPAPVADGGRRITFNVNAVDGTGEIVGEGTIVRAIVDRDRFLRSIGQ